MIGKREIYYEVEVTHHDSVGRVNTIFEDHLADAVVTALDMQEKHQSATVHVYLIERTLQWAAHE